MDQQFSNQPTWQRVVDVKREHRRQLVEPFLLKDSPDDGFVREIEDIEQLATSIAIGRFSAREVTEAYVRKSVLRHHFLF